MLDEASSNSAVKVAQDAATFQWEEGKAQPGIGIALSCDIDVTRKLALVGTRLSDLGEAISKQIVNWGYAVCDRSLRANYAGQMTAVLPNLPYPDAPLVGS